MMLAAEFVTRPGASPTRSVWPRASRPSAAEPTAVLAALRLADGASLRGLARRASLTPHRVADVLEGLAAAGLVEREGDHAWLTPTGLAAR